MSLAFHTFNLTAIHDSDPPRRTALVQGQARQMTPEAFAGAWAAATAEAMRNVHHSDPEALADCSNAAWGLSNVLEEAARFPEHFAALVRQPTVLRLLRYGLQQEAEGGRDTPIAVQHLGPNLLANEALPAEAFASLMDAVAPLSPKGWVQVLMHAGMASQTAAMARLAPLAFQAGLSWDDAMETLVGATQEEADGVHSRSLLDTLVSTCHEQTFAAFIQARPGGQDGEGGRDWEAVADATVRYGKVEHLNALMALALPERAQAWGQSVHHAWAPERTPLMQFLWSHSLVGEWMGLHEAGDWLEAWGPEVLLGADASTGRTPLRIAVDSLKDAWDVMLTHSAPAIVGALQRLGPTLELWQAAFPELALEALAAHTATLPASLGAVHAQVSHWVLQETTPSTEHGIRRPRM